MEGQISIFEYMAREYPVSVWGGCGNCVCKRCLYWQSERCPYGDCWDDHRAEINPYDKAHPDEPKRTAWSNWNRPGEQAHWCRGGVCYPIYGRECGHYVKCTGQQVRTCLDANVVVFQDGYIWCSLVDSAGCRQCYERWKNKIDKR